MSGNYVLSTSIHNGAGNFFQNVFHYVLSEAGSGTTPFEYADGLISKWITSILPSYLALMGQDVVLDFITARKLPPAGGIASVRVIQSAGSDTHNSISAGLAGDVAWLTNAPSNKPGHSYVSCLPTNAIDTDAITSAFFTKFGNWIAAMITPLTLAGALGDATFSMFTRKTATMHTVTTGLIKPKLTAIGRRLLPQI